ncbi:hypothetical protein [Paenibacillus polymyxa]|nr:hypothetical protein [Paenibacillus polymyxa]MDN4077608.1 hypothetical protein [Paenibacillus polymyxa]MDN4103033.1 hypothetical protein [Paenibacillus polymyxa]MDN4113248.1 hypothetical protein [Paenibacillus polymyxa]MEE4564862.1 hypothetical protein [Paenibacillus polymyxa]
MRRYRTGEVHRLEQQNGPSKKVQGTGKEVEPEVALLGSSPFETK